jgi:GNAT superfamily N-acetyltransferase
MPVTIQAVSTPRDKKAFIRFQWSIYRDDPNWAPPLLMERQDFLNPAKNPFFEHADVQLFLARDDQARILGRIAAIVNHSHIARHGEKVGFFGLFECIDDQGTANALLEAAAGYLRGKGMAVMRGPENISVNDDLGLLVKGFDSPPFAMMPHNPPYYERLVEGFGLGKVMDLFAYYGEHDGGPPERLARGMAIIRKRYHFDIRSIDMSRFAEEVERIKTIYNGAWEDNWGAIPMTDREFAHLAKDLKLVIDPALCLIAEVDGHVVGWSLGLPDLNQALIKMNGRLLPFGLVKLLWYKRKIDRIRVLTLGVLPEYRHMGISTALIHETYVRCVERGYKGGELSWILETNASMNNALINAGFKVHKTYRLYDYGL